MSQCQRCGREWRSLTQCHCTVCCSHFANYGAANLHWGSGKSKAAPAYDAPHLEPRDVPMLRQDERGVWHRADGRDDYCRSAYQEARNG